ncbi:MAG: hypothetical protein AAF125_23620, partial [Chloroflexota bacterium]
AVRNAEYTIGTLVPALVSKGIKVDFLSPGGVRAGRFDPSQIEAVVCLADAPCLSAEHLEDLVARMQRAALPVCVVAPLALLAATSLPDTVTQIPLDTAQLSVNPEQITRPLVDWIYNTVGTRSSDLKTDHLLSELQRHLVRAAVLYHHPYDCTFDITDIRRRAQTWTGQAALQLVEYVATDEPDHGHILRMHVEDLPALMAARRTVAIVGTRDGGRDDYLIALGVDAAVNALQSDEERVPVTLSLCDWGSGEPLRDFLRRAQPILTTRTAAEWQVILLLTDVPQRLLLDRSQLEALYAWAASDPRFEAVVLAAMPGHERALQAVGFSTLQLSPLPFSSDTLELFIAPYQVRAFYERLTESNRPPPMRPFDLHSLALHYQQRPGKPLPRSAGERITFLMEHAAETLAAAGDSVSPRALERALSKLAYSSYHLDQTDYIAYADAIEWVGDEALIKA